MGINKYVAPPPGAGVRKDALTRVVTDAFSIGREDCLHGRTLKYDMFMNDAEQGRYAKGYNMEKRDCEYILPYYTRFGKAD